MVISEWGDNSGLEQDSPGRSIIRREPPWISPPYHPQRPQRRAAIRSRIQSAYTHRRPHLDIGTPRTIGINLDPCFGRSRLPGPASPHDEWQLTPLFFYYSLFRTSKRPRLCALSLPIPSSFIRSDYHCPSQSGYLTLSLRITISVCRAGLFPFVLRSHLVYKTYRQEVT